MVRTQNLSVMDPYPAQTQDPDPAQAQDPDLTPFSSDFEDAKKNFLTFLSYNLPAGTLSSVLKIKFLAKKNLKASYQSAQHLYDKRKGSGAGSGSMDPDSDPEHWLLETKTKKAHFQDTKNTL